MTAPHTVESSNTPSALLSLRAADLLATGKPFVEFPRYSILDLQRNVAASLPPSNHRSDYGSAGAGQSSFADWLSKRLQIGHPFVIKDFEKLPQWDKRVFSIEGLIEHSTKKNIPIRNCSTSRDLSFTLRKFADAARQSYKEFKNLYARDLQCPEAWLEQCRKLLPPEVQWAGRLDLFQWLPPCARSEVMMAYVGSEGSSSGFHRCFSSTVALNLLVEGSNRPVFCFGTDFESQPKYDAFMASRGASPHVDWLNLSPDELKQADFPLYICEQEPGDLVVFPPATAHQVWNLGSISTKIVWNILHPLSLEAGLIYVQPPFNRLCHPDVAQSNLALACAMLSLLRDDIKAPIPPNLELLTQLFCQMVEEEKIGDQPATPITLVRLPETAIVTCDFCSTAIWNRHLRCSECEDFDLCLHCYLNGRSCEHIRSYSWAEIVSEETCARVLDRAQQILGFKVDDSRGFDRRKPLGSAVNDLMRAKKNNLGRLCHLCRIDHLEWKGRRCDRCSAFFCFRGLYRHFDMNSADVMRHSGLWVCPKCLEMCNCRCCHFSSAYTKAEKPASKRRVKPADARGKIMGFTDNVFDQKRRNMSASSGNSNSAALAKGQKRPSSAAPSIGGLLQGISEHSAITPNTVKSSGRGSDYFSADHKNDPIYSSQKEGEPRQAKIPKLSHRTPTASPPRRDDNKILHSIDFITRMPSPVADRVSLPPLKSRCSPESMSDPGSSPSMNQSCTDIIVAGCTAAFDSIPSPAHYGRDNDREFKYSIQHSSTMAKTTPPLSRDYQFPQPTAHTHTTTISNVLSLSNRLPPYQSTTAAPQHQFRPTATNTITSAAIPTSLASISTSTQTSTSSPTPSSLATIESQLHRLRQYSDELLALSLHDSHRILQQEIRHVEETLLLAKRERSERLIKAFETEFPGLVEVREGVKREGAKLGYF